MHSSSPRSHRAPGPLRPALFSCLILFGAVLDANSAVAADRARGRLEGRVGNAAQGTYLTNARVLIGGTSLETFSDPYGNYHFEDGQF